MVGRLERGASIITLFLVMLILTSLPGMALQAQMPGAIQPSTSRALFLEHYLIANGSVVKGEAPFRSVNFPTYWYNANTKQLNGKIDFSINSSLILVFGDVLTLKGNFGAGTGNKLYGVYSLPAFTARAYVYSMDDRGNMFMILRQKNVLLKPGESYSYSENETLQDHGAEIRVMYNHTYINHGFIDKRQIGTRPISPKIFF